MSRVVVVGAGIVGLAVGRGCRLAVMRSSSREGARPRGASDRTQLGVVHSGLYYKPGSYKATMSAAGAKSIIAFAKEHGIAHDICGKLVVATDDKQVPELHRLAARAVENGVPSRLISAAEAKEYEPHVNAVAALRVESTGIIDYPGSVPGPRRADGCRRGRDPARNGVRVCAHDGRQGDRHDVPWRDCC